VSTLANYSARTASPMKCQSGSNPICIGTCCRC
jgi:hypothetical protein